MEGMDGEGGTEGAEGELALFQSLPLHVQRVRSKLHKILFNLQRSFIAKRKQCQH